MVHRSNTYTKDLLTECEVCTGKYCLRFFVQKKESKVTNSIFKFTAQFAPIFKASNSSQYFLKLGVKFTVSG